MSERFQYDIQNLNYLPLNMFSFREMLKEATVRSRFVRNKTLEAASQIDPPGNFFTAPAKQKLANHV